jgi:hypothetical protein
MRDLKELVVDYLANLDAQRAFQAKLGKAVEKAGWNNPTYTTEQSRLSAEVSYYAGCTFTREAALREAVRSKDVKGG